MRPFLNDRIPRVSRKRVLFLLLSLLLCFGLGVTIALQNQQMLSAQDIGLEALTSGQLQIQSATLSMPNYADKLTVTAPEDIRLLTDPLSEMVFLRRFKSLPNPMLHFTATKSSSILFKTSEGEYAFVRGRENYIRVKDKKIYCDVSHQALMSLWEAVDALYAKHSPMTKIAYAD